MWTDCHIKNYQSKSRFGLYLLFLILTLCVIEVRCDNVTSINIYQVKAVKGFNWSYFPTILTMLTMMIGAITYFVKTKCGREKEDNGPVITLAIQDKTSNEVKVSKVEVKVSEVEIKDEVEMTELGKGSSIAPDPDDDSSINIAPSMLISSSQNDDVIFPELLSSGAKRLDQVTWLGTFLSNKKANQDINLDQQFEMGVRYFNVKLKWHYEIKTKCYGRKMVEYTSLDEYGNQGALYFFDKIKDWLNDNTRTILTIYVQNNFDVDENVEGTAFITELEDMLIKSDLLGLCYTFKAITPPTIDQMIRTNKRLIILTEKQLEPMEGKTWINTHQQFSEYNNISQGDDSYRKINTTSFMKCMNHRSNDENTTLEDYDHINSFMAIQNHVKTFTKNAGKYPNYVIVNFVGKGDCKKVIQALNLEDRP